MERAAFGSVQRCLRGQPWTIAVRAVRSSSHGSASRTTALLAPSIYQGQRVARESTSCLAQVPQRRQCSSTTVRADQKFTSRRAAGRRKYSTQQSSLSGTDANGIEEEAVDLASDAAQVTVGEGGLRAPEHLNAKEREIWELLNSELACTSLDVRDISGGCGSMYGIEIVSERFRGMGMLGQQRLVNSILGEEIKTWHGVQLKTRAP